MRFTKKQTEELLYKIMGKTLPKKHQTKVQINNILEKHPNLKQQFGRIVLYDGKSNFGKRGYVVDNLEDLYKVSNSNNFSHFTPNTYFDISATNLTTNNTKIRAVNMLVIDLDFSDQYEALYNWENQIKGNTNIDNDIKSAYVLLTDKGLQIGYIFENPVFLSNNYEKQLYSIEQIYKNIINILKIRFKNINNLLIDEKDTAFGIQRFPKRSNLLEIKIKNLIDFEKTMYWSMRVSNVAITGKKNNNKFVPKIIFGSNRQTENDWYVKMTSDDQLQKINHEGARDNLFTTLALANKSSGVDQQECEKNLQKFNDKTLCPLSERIVSQKVDSIYRGSCKGAQNSYINLIIKTYNLDIELRDETKNANGSRVHQKMTREHRTRLHVSERVDSLISCLNGHLKATLSFSELETALEYKIGTLRTNHIKTINKDPRIKIRKVKNGKYNISIISIEKTGLSLRVSKAG